MLYTDKKVIQSIFQDSMIETTDDETSARRTWGPDHADRTDAEIFFRNSIINMNCVT